MTTVYFVRHAEPNFQNHDDLTRELSARGLKDSTTINYFEPSFGCNEFNEIKGLMPWNVGFSFESGRFLKMQKYDIKVE